MGHPSANPQVNPYVCGKPTRRGGACKLPVVVSARSCVNHLTSEERAEHDRRKAEPSPFAAPDPTKPACWAWPVVTVADLVDLACQGLSAQVRSMVLSNGGGSFAMSAWQDTRCAVCGHRTDSLVLDHDHATTLIRGYLCRSCNVREAHTGGVFEMYRQRNPATILGVREAYWNDVAEALNPQSLRPTPPPTDPWVNNPSAGIGL